MFRTTTVLCSLLSALLSAVSAQETAADLSTTVSVRFEITLTAAVPPDSCPAPLSSERHEELFELVQRGAVTGLNSDDVLILFIDLTCKSHGTNADPSEFWETHITEIVERFDQNVFEEAMASWGRAGQYQQSDAFDRELILRGAADQYSINYMFENPLSAGVSVDEQLSRIARRFVAKRVMEENQRFIREMSDDDLKMRLSTSTQTASAFTLLIKHVVDKDELVRIEHIVDGLNEQDAIMPYAFMFLKDWFSIRLRGEQVFGTYLGCEGERAVFVPAVRDEAEALRLRQAYNYEASSQKLLSDYEKRQCES